MKLSKLLATRQALLRQTHLANLAFAYQTLQNFVARIHRCNLRGLVRLRPADPADDCYWATLTALEGSQSILEEHFADGELLELAEALAIASEFEFSSLDFRLEELGDKHLIPLRHTLENAGVKIDSAQTEPNVAADSGDEFLR